MNRLATVLEAVRRTRSRVEKETRLADYLKQLDDATLPHAARMISGRVFTVDDPRAIRAGYVAWRSAASLATGWDPEIVTDSMRACGDPGEAIGLLVAADPTAANRIGPTLLDVVAVSERLAAMSRPLHRVRLLSETLRIMPGLSAKYFVKLLAGGLRVGAQQGVIEGAIARASGVSVDDVHRALARTSDIGEVAVLARAGALDRAQLHIGRPIAFMLATPLQSVRTPPSGEGWRVEDKLDGIRAQVHRVGTRVRVFARSGDPIDGTFPEIERAIRTMPEDLVLDGEIVAIRDDGGIAPFAWLQERLNRRVIEARDLTRRPVAFVAFDLLADGTTGAWIDRSWTARRERLESLLALAGNPTIRILPTDRLLGRDIEELRRAALERGAEGLVLKREDAQYEPGRRGQSWIKVKEPFATLDVVITAAEEGHGKRRGMLSDYTFGVWNGDELVNVGKAYSGLTDDEIETLTMRLSRLTLARYGRVRAIRPEIVLEVAFDGIQRSKRHRSGFALRFPRIVRIRSDKAPSDANGLADVEALFARQGSRVRVE